MYIAQRTYHFGGKTYKQGDEIPDAVVEKYGPTRVAKVEAPAEAPTSLSDHTVPQLKEIAAGLNIEGASSMRKDELVAAIEATEDQ